LFDVIIVGSGPSAVSALESLKTKKVLVIDPGLKASSQETDSLNLSLNDLKKSGKIELDDVIGRGLESFHNVFEAYLSPKLKAPLMRFITNRYLTESKFETNNFFVMGSHAKGGLSNAWGAGSMRYTAEELAEFPISYDDLAVYYDKLTEIMGINGSVDDLNENFVSSEGLLPPPKLNSLMIEFLNKYTKKKKYFHSIGMKIGFPRSAYLTKQKNNRNAYDYKAMEFFKSTVSSIYNSANTLDDLLSVYKTITYLSGHEVINFNEVEDGVEVFCKDISSDAITIKRCRKLVIGAGCLNTARIVLRSYSDYKTRIPILDNLVTYVPFFYPKFIGKMEDKDVLPPQLILMYKYENQEYLCSMYKLNVTLWGDFIMDFPLSIRGAVRAVKYLLPSIFVMQVFYPDRAKGENYLQLNAENGLKIEYGNEVERGNLEKKIISNFRKIGFFSASFLVKKLTPGNSFHYSGSLPMKVNPQNYETDQTGRLAKAKNVYIVDGSVFPNLPSKNNTLTIMANAMRVGEIVNRSLA